MVSPTNWNKKKRGKTKKFQKAWGKKWWWATDKKKKPDQQRFYLFTVSSFLVFRLRFFLCLNAVVDRLSHFIQIWKNLSQLPASKCEERRLIDQFRRKEKKWNMLVTSSRRHEHQGLGTASCHSLHPLDLLISLLSFYHFSIFSHSNLCFPSVLVPLKLFPLQFTLVSFPHSPIYLDRCSGYSLHQRKRTIVRGL